MIYEYSIYKVKSYLVYKKGIPVRLMEKREKNWKKIC